MDDNAPVLAPGFDAQSLEVKRRRAMAKLLQESQMPQGQMVSGHYVAPPLLGSLNAVARQLMGAYGERKADEQESELERTKRAALIKAVRGGDTDALLEIPGYEDVGVKAWMEKASEKRKAADQETIDRSQIADTIDLKGRKVGVNKYGEHIGEWVVGIDPEGRERLDFEKYKHNNQSADQRSADKIARESQRITLQGQQKDLLKEFGGTEADYGIDPTGGGAAVPATPTGTTDIQQDMLAVAGQYGAQPTSLTRSPEKNAAVGGVPNSRHLTGEAGDFVVPQENKPAFKADMEARGFKVLDEGDHMHVQAQGQRGFPSKAEREAEATRLKASVKDAPQLEKEKTARVDAMQKADIVIGKVDEALGQVSGSSTGLRGQVLRNIGGTDAANLQQTLAPIKANIGFQELQKMREASPTGGALGQVAVQELNYLQSSLASLDTVQNPDQLKRNLTQVRTHYANWKATMQQEDLGISEEDMQATMKETGLTRPQVIQELSGGR